MKLKSIVVAGLIAATVSPAMAAPAKRNIRKELKSIKTEVIGQEILINSDRSTQALREKAAAKKAELLDELKVIQYEQCKKKKGLFVIENDEGKCLTGNPCKSSNDEEKKYCADTFEKVRVADIAQATVLVEDYAVNVLKWSGCAPLSTSKKQSGKSFITCTNPNAEELRVFKFKNVAEEDEGLAKTHFLYGLCVANGGNATLPKKEMDVFKCKGIEEEVCTDAEGINGTYNKGICYMDPSFLDND